MRWVAIGKDEFAFLSIGGVARGVIAIGGVAHGVVAIGGALSVGVISIGMNAVGSVVALGMNTAAPVSISLINALGLYVVAGVNGCGAFTRAGVNATGLEARGGTNSEASLIPALLTLAALLVASSVARGSRASRRNRGVITLPRFLRRKPERALVRARLRRVTEAGLVLAGAGETLELECEDETTRTVAQRLAEQHPGQEPEVVAELVTGEISTLVPGEVGYRVAPKRETSRTHGCRALAGAPPALGLLPANANEVQWVVAWSARFSVLAFGLFLLARWL